MRHIGYPEKIVIILEKMYEGTFSAVRAAGGLSEWFETVVGVLARQCVVGVQSFRHQRMARGTVGSNAAHAWDTLKRL